MPDYEKLTVIKLREELVARGLPKAGLKAALVQRLNEADAQSEKLEPAASEPSVGNQDDESVDRAATWVSQAPREPGINNAADDRPQSRDHDADKLNVADMGDRSSINNPDDFVRLQNQTEDAQEHEQFKDQAPDSPTEPSGYAPIPNGTQSEDLSEKANEKILEPELQLPTPAQTQIGDVQVAVDKAGVSIQTWPTGDGFSEDSRKRKRRSQSPPPPSVEITQKKLKTNSGRPLVELPEDLSLDCTNQKAGPGDKSSQLDPIHAQEKDTQHNGHTCSNGESKLAKITTPATLEKPDAEGISLSQTHSSTLEDLDSMKERNATPKDAKRISSPMKPSPSDTRFKNLFTIPANLDPAFQQSHYADAEEKTVSPALHPATSALYIRELMRPLKLESLRDHLIALATPPDTAVNPHIVTEFFLDAIRTHCLVGFGSISAASRVRSGLHDRIWPNERDRRQLWVDFVPEEELKSWIDLERTEGNSRGHPSKRWEVVYKDEQSGIKASLQEVGSNSGGLRAVKPLRLAAGQIMQVAEPRASGSEPRNTQLRPDSGKGFQALDDLFTSTAAKPKLYYLPVKKAEANGRLAKLAAGRGGGRGDEMRRFSFEEGSIVDNGPELGRGGYGRGGNYSGSYRGRGRGYRADVSRGDRWREWRTGY